MHISLCAIYAQGKIQYKPLFLGVKVIGFCFCVIFLGSVLLNVHYLRSMSDSRGKDHHSAGIKRGKGLYINDVIVFWDILTRHHINHLIIFPLTRHMTTNDDHIYVNLLNRALLGTFLLSDFNLMTLTDSNNSFTNE